MAIRDFTDERGTMWRVWQTVPDVQSVLHTPLRDGWLTFASDKERRRLMPIPPGWEDVDEERLALLCRAAVPVNRIVRAAGERDQDDNRV